MKSWLPCTALTAAALVVAASVAAGSQDSGLGVIHFPTSGAPEAQKHFLRGVAALHSFWYEEAEEAFREAQAIDPDFAMAYWGEAMTYNHPLWAEQDIARARDALSRLGASRAERLAKAPTEREKGYLEAVEILYGPGDKLARDIAYSKAMERLMKRFPDDDEAACFYALSLLGTVRPGDKGYRRQMQAAAVLQKVFQKNPQHPGVAHYTIHAFDDPDHAILALDAARLYARIAPEAPHALHMPSHIFLQLGMWEDVAASNLAAYEASDKWVQRKGLSLAKRDYHSWEWRQYANLQLGRWREASDAVGLVREVAEATGDARVRRYAASMHARYVVETGRWEDLPLVDVAGDVGRYSAVPDVLVAAGLAAAHRGDGAKAAEAARRLAALADGARAKGDDYRARYLTALEKQVLATLRTVEGRGEEGLALAAEAAALEETLDPPSGPPHPLKPSHELYGELLLAAGKPAEAKAAFDTALVRMPRRSASLIGLARAARALGDEETAREAYGELAKNWKDADPDVPGLEEARGGAATTEEAASH